MALTLDRRAIGRGSAAYLAMAVPCGLIIALLHGSDTPGHESNLWIAAVVVVIFLAPIIGGAVAGAAQPHAPLTHAAVAVGGPAATFLVVRAVVGQARGTLSAGQGLTFVLYLAVFTGFAVLGGYLAFRRQAAAR